MFKNRFTLNGKSLPRSSIGSCCYQTFSQLVCLHGPRKEDRNTKDIIEITKMIGENNPGIDCCCFRCCTCINISFMKSENGLLKFAEIILGSLCQSLAVNFGLSHAATMGAAYQGFVTTAAWCLMTTFLLCVCYLVSCKTASLIRQSIFELVFNAVAAFNYISASSYLGFVVKTFLYPQYIIVPHFEVYPAMTAAYMVGTLVGLVHGYDAYKAYKYYKGYR